MRKWHIYVCINLFIFFLPMLYMVFLVCVYYSNSNSSGLWNVIIYLYGEYEATIANASKFSARTMRWTSTIRTNEFSWKFCISRLEYGWIGTYIYLDECCVTVVYVNLHYFWRKIKNRMQIQYAISFINSVDPKLRMSEFCKRKITFLDIIYFSKK